jgi:hypothetical protein
LGLDTLGAGAPLAYAIMLENTAMLQLLLENGASFQQLAIIKSCSILGLTERASENALVELVEAAKEEGLESMLALMKEHGVDVD